MFMPNAGGYPNINADLMAGQRDLDMAGQMMNAGYAPNSGWLGVLAQVAQAWGGKKLAKRGDERIADALARQLEEDSRRQMAEREQAARDEQKAYERDLGRRRAELTDPVLNPQKPRDPIKVGNQIVQIGEDGTARVLHTAPRAPQQERAPTAFETQIAMARALGASPEELRALALGQGGANAAKPTPEQRETAKLEAARLKDAEDRARAAQKTLATVNQLEAMLGKGVATGPLDQYLPGKERQLFNALASELNLSTLRQNFGGNPTEGERAANAATLPGVGQYEANNRELLAKLRTQAEGILGEYQSLAGGGGPTVGAPQASPAAQAAPVNVPRAVNPQTGETLVLINGQWVPE